MKKHLSFKKVLLAAFVAFASSTTLAQIIIEDDVEGNGDNSAITGTITTAWAGWNGAGSSPYFDLLDDAADDDAGIGGVSDQLALEALNGDIPFSSGPSSISVTYGGTLAEGLYTLQLQVVNWGNFGFPNVDSITIAGVAPTPVSTVIPALEQDEIWSYDFEITAAEASNPITLALELSNSSGSFNNLGIDHVVVTAIPEPSSAAFAFGFLGLVGMVLSRRRSLR